MYSPPAPCQGTIRPVKRRTLLTILSWVLALAIIAVLVWFLDPAKIWSALCNTDPFLVLASMACLTLAFVIKALRWFVIARGLSEIRLSGCVRLMFAGMLINILVPVVRGGDVGRALVLSRESSLGKAEALGTVAMDKLMDMIGVAVIVAPLPFLDSIPPWIRWPPVATISTALVLMAAGILLRIRMKRHDSSPEGLARPLRWLASFASGFDTALRPATMAISASLTVAVYAMLWVSVLLAVAAAGFGWNFEAAFLSLLAIQFAAGVPLTPGSAGTMHGAIAGVLVATGSGTGAAMGAAIVVHATQMLPLILLGVLTGRATALVRESGPPGEDPPGA